MRSLPLAHALLAAVLLAGCADGRTLDPARCGPAGDIGVAPEGPVALTVQVRHEGTPPRDVVVCIRLDEHAVAGVVVRGGDPGADPDTDVVVHAAGRYGATVGSEVRVGASILDDDQAAIESFPVTETNLITVVVEKGYTLRVEKA